MASYQNQNQNQNEDHIVIQPSHAEPYTFSYNINNNNHEALELHIAQQHDQLINGINQTVYLYDAFTSPKADIILSLDQILSRRNRKNCKTNLPCSENTTFSHQVMKVLTWNARGAGRAEFEAEMKQHVFEHKPHVLIIVGTEAVIDETRMDEEPFEGLAVLAWLGFDRRIVLGADEEAGSGGIWFFWDSNHVEPASMFTSPEFIGTKMVLINNYLPESPP